MYLRTSRQVILVVQVICFFKLCLFQQVEDVDIVASKGQFVDVAVDVICIYLVECGALGKILKITEMIKIVQNFFIFYLKYHAVD